MHTVWTNVSKCLFEREVDSLNGMVVLESDRSSAESSSALNTVHKVAARRIKSIHRQQHKNNTQVVKASVVYQKNPAQHAAGIEMLEATAEKGSAFIKPDTSIRKAVECVRVDGTSDESPQLS